MACELSNKPELKALIERLERKRAEHWQSLLSERQKLMHQLQVSCKDVKGISAAVKTIPVAVPAESSASDTQRTGLTKLQRAKLLYLRIKDQPRTVIINQFMAELNMTKAGAASYYQQCKIAVKLAEASVASGFVAHS